MNFIERIIFRMEAKKMLDAAKLYLSKYAPAVIAALSVLLVLVGFTYGPVDVPLGLGSTVHIPAVDMKTLLGVVWPIAVAVLHHIHLSGNASPASPGSLPVSK